MKTKHAFLEEDKIRIRNKESDQLRAVVKYLYDSNFEVTDGSPLFRDDREPANHLPSGLGVILQTAMYVLS